MPSRKFTGVYAFWFRSIFLKHAEHRRRAQLVHGLILAWAARAGVLSVLRLGLLSDLYPLPAEYCYMHVSPQRSALGAECELLLRSSLVVPMRGTRLLQRTISVLKTLPRQ